jgi:hypothetical protein
MRRIVALLAALGAALALAATSIGTSPSPTSLAATMDAGSCTLRAVKPLPPLHDPSGQAGGYHADVPTLNAKVRWSTDPPSAGAHYAAWAVWAFYGYPVNPRQVVHNEEHGGVIVWWGSKVSKKTIAKIRSFYASSPYGVLATPYPKLGAKIALTAWTGNPNLYYQHGHYGVGHIAVCRRYDKTAFTAFRKAYRGKGPEGIPLSLDKPGTGPG